ncbi:hypothetical protein DFJ74DRAFT_675612 [Hyaloraphidium curvatum]|nr:hypothetical protein DFJ74DRAFT_675612 [Hyaloraphidium curvatum]
MAREVQQADIRGQGRASGPKGAHTAARAPNRHPMLTASLPTRAPQEFEAALDSYADSPLLRSLLSRVLSALLSRPVDTSDAALVPALRSAIARHIDRDPALNDFWGTDNPMEGAETMAPFWALTAENKAKTFRYLAEWATAVGRIKTAVDVAYEDRESAANTLWVPRVGKDRNRNSFWRLEGFPRIWRETVAGRWSVISDNVADMRKFAETLATDKPAQERELRRKILEELAPNYEETEKRKNRAERRIQKLERQLAVVAAGPVRTTRSRPVSYNVDVDDREFEKMLKTPKKDAPPEKVFRDGFRKTRRGADTTELVELPSNWKDVGRPRDRRRISEEDGESTLAGTGEDGEAHDTEESDLDSVASMETEDEGAPPAKKASPGVSAPAGAIGA